MAKKTNSARGVNPVKIILTCVLCLIIAGLVAAGVCCWGYAARGEDGKWFGNIANISTWHWSDKSPDTGEEDKPGNGDNSGDNNKPDNSSDGELPGTDKVEVKNAGFLLTTANNAGNKIRLRSSLTSVGGVASQAENGYTLTAQINPADADNKKVDWAVKTIAGSDTLTNGQPVTNYVTVAATSDGALEAKVNCLAAFGERIKIVCTSRENPEIKAECVCDYVKRITGITFNTSEINFIENGYTYTVDTSAYTIDSTIDVTVGDKMTLTSDFVSIILSKYSDDQYVYETDWWFAPDKAASISTDYNNQKINFVSIDKSFADCFTYPDDEYTSEEIAEMQSYINAAFRQAVNSFTETQATFDVSYTATYNGVTYSSGTETVNCNFNYSSLHVPVGSLSLSDGNIIF